MSQQSNNHSTTAKSKKRLWIGGSILIIVLCLAIFNFDTISEIYTYLFNTTHFEKGDKVYAPEDYFDPKGSGYTISVYRLIRPLTSGEIDDDLSSTFNDRKKDRLKEKSDLNKKPYLIAVGVGYVKDKMLKQHTALLGTYLDKALMYAKIKEENFEGTELFYAIKPNINNIEMGPVPYADIPETYTLADSAYYISPFITGKQEASVFKR
ncbi:hypothetical protein [Mucilaginibacter celer]|uniref:Uncharacterized protein n=1 Tax=Mucilaginibacter celer TaxID=2305508 RepID=A0A494VNY5_9SPHI|nr:hypothetical protein [Mucilaginibacter celer]AYL96414.1 hypothetical protein HYN43_014395 [Mucilaginibacter celer]